MPDVADDLELLRAFEPVLRFTQGEYFFPVSVERYAAQATLWSNLGDGLPVIQAGAGELTLPTLAQAVPTTQGIGQSLSGIRTGEEPPKARIPAKDRPPRLRGGSRLAAVGLIGRIVDALNRLSLLFRGSVAGGSAARSFGLQNDRLEPDRPVYYGRVIRDGGYIVCQYWFFYAFNNWRSAFGGVNEHEADWEQVTVYLDGATEVAAGGLPAPRWVVFSAHDETGDDLRRRWDDPDLTLVEGRHPVVHVGAGSHSGAYLAGDYLITIEPPHRGGILKVLRWFGRLFTPWSPGVQEGLGIPYVDYARGDGRAVGPGQSNTWTPVVIDEATSWVRDFRGLWGHDTRDRLGGERGPAGPRYERDGSVRMSWAEPAGWAGLAKVAPNPQVERELIAARGADIDVRLAQLEAQVVSVRRQLGMLAAGLAPDSPPVRALTDQEEHLLNMRMEQTRLRDERASMRVDGGDAVDPHAHLRHRRTPMEEQSRTRKNLLAGWAVLSTPLILMILASIVAPGTAGVRTEVAVAGLVLLLAVEGFVRGHFLDVVMRVLVMIALAVGLWFLWTDWRVMLSAVLTAAAIVILVVNLKEAWRR